jgi:hypothetical protein
MAGDKCEPPSSLAHDASQKWIAGWHDGQTILMSAFKKKRPVDAPDTDDIDEGALSQAEKDLAAHKAAHGHA